MALSNWDTLAFDKNGNSTNGVFDTGKIQVKIYKNWLYVHDSVAWEVGSGFENDTIMQLSNGDITYKNIRNAAKRGRQNSVMCMVWTDDYRKNGRDRYEIMVGCGVYGYRRNSWVGVEMETYNKLREFVTKVAEYEFSTEDVIILPDNPLRFNQGDAFFAKNLSIDMPVTEIGNTGNPVLEKVLRD